MNLMKLLKLHWKKIVLIAFVIMIVSLIVVIWFKPRTVLSPIIPPTNKVSVKKVETKNQVVVEPEKKSIIKSNSVTVNFDKSKYSTTDSSSIWVVVNKQHPLIPIDYIPNDLISTVGATISSKAKIDFDLMNNAALAEGVNFTIVSSYRSYATQSSIYNNYVASYGQATTDTFSARPGYSEHQTGLTIDFGSSSGAVCNLDDCFGSTNEGKWLASRSWEFGYILRYPSDKQQITGYKSEPWHFRYIGRELSTEMKKLSITTLEEYFNISGGEIYI